MENKQKYEITIKPFPDGEIVHIYKNNPEFGYIVLESQEPYFCPTYLNEFLSSNGDKTKIPKRLVCLRGKTETLKKIVKASHNKTLPGRIIVTEYLEDEIPEDVISLNLRDDVPFEEAIKPYLLLVNNKNDSIENKIRDRFKEKSNDEFLTKNGKRILRFFKYDIKEDTEDIFIKGFDIKLDPSKIKFIGVEAPDKEEDTKENSNPQNSKKSLSSVKRENAVMVPLVAMLVLGGIVSLIMMPSFATTVGIIFGALIMFFFAGWIYQMIFQGEMEFSMLRSIVSGVVVILVIALVMFIMELTKTPNDPEMWRHP